MSEEKLRIEGDTYLGTKEAGKFSGYTHDYISKLAREGNIGAKRFSGRWYVSRRSLLEFLRSRGSERQTAQRKLSKNRKREYKRALCAHYVAQLPHIVGSATHTDTARQIFALLSSFALVFGGFAYGASETGSKRIEKVVIAFEETYLSLSARSFTFFSDSSQHTTHDAQGSNVLGASMAKSQETQMRSISSAHLSEKLTHISTKREATASVENINAEAQILGSLVALGNTTRTVLTKGILVFPYFPEAMERIAVRGSEGLIGGYFSVLSSSLSHYKHGIEASAARIALGGDRVYSAAETALLASSSEEKESESESEVKLLESVSSLTVAGLLSGAQTFYEIQKMALSKTLRDSLLEAQRKAGEFAKVLDGALFTAKERIEKAISALFGKG